MKSKKVVHGERIIMKTVMNFDELTANMQLLDEYLESNTDPEYSYALALVKRGTCFIALPYNGTYKFYPSRFTGYAKNNMDAHQNNNQKDGRDTNPAISMILGMKPKSNPKLDKIYRDYCESLGFVANERGSFGVERKYWVLSL